ncbi:hypothetical protein BO78DRAFT_328616 [Aspergillus sclerotiicarbonarius CBS 121057]|uniref:Tim17-domain-containing protein n=1 Tax=Aspergillus sclerotiicarbonarius (strain CBS 121057 / IBT 28362) TaxID=1448318 RepID=A0A319E3F5_ASPSB|nr:hypothetical protein BO78DRAFT_328616 [Aspergillus sclerotiicarbonarius CBS 121057]
MDDQDSSTRPNQENSLLYKIIYWDKFFESDAPPRLGMGIKKRLNYVTLSAFSAGLGIGYSHGSKMLAYRFRAENAHRFPESSQGWFQYHKTKNYISLIGGVKEGFRMGAKLGTGALLFCLFEETVDYARHDQRDFLSTVTAGLSFSGIYSLLGRHDVYTAARTARLGLRLSLAYGLLQDALETAKGNRPAYVDFILGSRRSKTE